MIARGNPIAKPPNRPKAVNKRVTPTPCIKISEKISHIMISVLKTMFGKKTITRTNPKNKPNIKVKGKMMSGMTILNKNESLNFF